MAAKSRGEAKFHEEANQARVRGNSTPSRETSSLVENDEDDSRSSNPRRDLGSRPPRVFISNELIIYRLL